MQVKHSNTGESYTEIVVPRPGDDDIPTAITVSKPLYGKIRYVACFTCNVQMHTLHVKELDMHQRI